MQVGGSLWDLEMKCLPIPPPCHRLQPQIQAQWLGLVVDLAALG